MLLAQSPSYLIDLPPPEHAQALPVLRVALTEKPNAHGHCPVSSHLAFSKSQDSLVSFGQLVWARVEALRTWAFGSPDYAHHAPILWKGEQQETLQLLINDLRDVFEESGLPGLVEQLMGKDALEKQIIFQRLLQTLRSGDESRQQLVEFARSTAILEKSTLDFLNNTVTAFCALDGIVFDGARLLRGAIHEIGETTQHAELKATNLARVILSKLHETHFDSAIHVLRQGIKSDISSTRPSALSVQLLGLMAEKSTFAAVRLGVRVSSELFEQLINFGVRGYLSSDDLARVLLIGAESGSSELPYLLCRYLGIEAAESICAHTGALEAFKRAFIALPITLWPPSSMHRRDRLLSNMDRLLSESQVSKV
jgi:hypothetical protein